MKAFARTATIHWTETSIHDEYQFGMLPGSQLAMKEEIRSPFDGIELNQADRPRSCESSHPVILVYRASYAEHPGNCPIQQLARFFPRIPNF